MCVDVSESGPLGPMWPQVSPSEEVALCEAKTLTLEIEVAAGVTNEELIRRLRELSIKADDYHRALGGGGLKVDDLRIEQEVVEFEGAPQ